MSVIPLSHDETTKSLAAVICLSGHPPASGKIAPPCIVTTSQVRAHQNRKQGGLHSLPFYVFGSNALGKDPTPGTLAGTTWVAENYQLVLAPRIAEQMNNPGVEMHMEEKNKARKMVALRIPRARAVATLK